LSILGLGISARQAELSVAAALRDYLDVVVFAASAQAGRRLAVARRLEDVWKVSFVLGFPSSAEEELVTLGQLAEQVEAKEAFSLSEALRFQLKALGAAPSSEPLPVRFWVEGLEEEAVAGDYTAVLLSGLGVGFLAVGLLVWRLRKTSKCASKARKEGRDRFEDSFEHFDHFDHDGKDLWQQEAERWALAEEAIQIRSHPSMPSRWRGVWYWDNRPQEHRCYRLVFGVGGQFSGSMGEVEVNGAFKNGMLKWRERDAHWILECTGEYSLCPPRIDGHFSAYDISALPKCIGQGRLTLTEDTQGAMVTKADQPAPAPPAVTSDLV